MNCVLCRRWRGVRVWVCGECHWVEECVCERKVGGGGWGEGRGAEGGVGGMRMAGGVGGGEWGG